MTGQDRYQGEASTEGGNIRPQVSLEWALIAAAFRARSYLNNPFKNISPKPRWRKTLLNLPVPPRRYVIYFTPRSGSSRLTDLLDRAGDLGSPGECFNPLMLRKMASFFGARNLAEYVDLLQRKRATNGTFGCEITIEHLYAIFFTAQRFFDIYRPTSTVFLIRENIVEQAVSLSRMNQTGLSHQLSPAPATAERADFRYLPAQIHRYLARIVRMEQQAERIFAASKLQPLRLSYETLIATAPAVFVSRIAEHIGAQPGQISNLTSDHTKMADGRSLEFTRRFCADNRRALGRLEKARRKTLELHSLQQV